MRQEFARTDVLIGTYRWTYYLVLQGNNDEALLSICVTSTPPNDAEMPLAEYPLVPRGSLASNLDAGVAWLNAKLAGVVIPYPPPPPVQAVYDFSKSPPKLITPAPPYIPGLWARACKAVELRKLVKTGKTRPRVQIQ